MKLDLAQNYPSRGALKAHCLEMLAGKRQMEQPDLVVFIVDDDDKVRRATRLLIRSAGWKARTYPSAEAFLTAYVARQSGCLILDLEMPGMNGAELQETLLARDILMPVIVVTGNPHSPLARRCEKAGALAVLTKPIAGVDLLSHIQHALARVLASDL